MYETKRENFDKLLKMYFEYLDLYRFFNGGKTGGETPFADFYWKYHYFYKHKITKKT